MTDLPPLTLLEEFLVLALDEKTGRLHSMDPLVLNSATAGAILMDLALRNRVDNDQNDMFTVDPSPTGDELLDPVLHTMSLAPVLAPHPISYWLKHLAAEAESLREKVLQRLKKRGIVRSPLTTFFWSLGPQSIGCLDEEKARDLKARLSHCLFDDETPGPRNVMLIGLIDACNLFPFVLKESDREAAAPRIAHIAQLDMISQAVAKGIILDAHPSETAKENS
ncbi:MAG: GPP34 family phosphoprotein [Alphaproteobacteria bacterium]|nr:GPP34 family phosphoprotein [Alphaproteobacteria bacterium]